MKKILISLCALMAFVGCMDKSFTAPEIVISESKSEMVSPLEISIGEAITKSFDENLKWSWRESDKILGYQVSGTKYVNTLSLKRGNVFQCPDFMYATQDPATFHFIYAGDAVVDNSVGGTRGIKQAEMQSGRWNPVLVGSVLDETLSGVLDDEAIINMEHLSAALEIRLWREGVDKENLTEVDKKNIKYAELISDSRNFLLDLVPVYNVDGTVAYNERVRGGGEPVGASVRTEEMNSPVVVFNVAPNESGYEKGDLTLAITDENGDKYVLDVPAINFYSGKRTVLNVEWKTPSSAYLPAVSTFNLEINRFLNSYPSITKIKFIARTEQTTSCELVSHSGTDGSKMYLRQNGQTLEVLTSGDQFIPPANCDQMFDATLSYLALSIVNSLSTIVDIDFGDSFNTTGVTSLKRFFKGCRALQSVNMSNFNTENVLDMSYMFTSCNALRSVDLSGFDTGNVAGMSNMFDGCKVLTSIDLSNFNTEKVTSMYSMFSGCKSVVNILLGNQFVTDKCTSMAYMFSGCEALNSVDVSRFNVEKVIGMQHMFANCKSLTSLDLKNFRTSALLAMFNMFESCESLQSLDLGKFDTSKVTDMTRLFYKCKKMESVSLGSFNTELVTKIDGMFESCQSLTELDLSKFNTSKLTNMKGMFCDCRALRSLDISGFDTKNVTNMNGMFVMCQSLESLDVGSFNTAKVTDMGAMFDACQSLVSLDLSKFNTEKVTKMNSMFSSCIKLETLDVSNFNTLNVSEMSYMFYRCTNLKELDLTSFAFEEGSIYMNSMFESVGANAENKPISIYVTQNGYDNFTGRSTWISNKNAKYVVRQ